MKKEKLKGHIHQLRGLSYRPNQILKSLEENTIPVLKANNITDDGLDISDIIYISKDFVKDNQILKKGDILLAASSGSKKVIGKNVSFDLDSEFSFGAFCKAIRPKSSIYPGYLKHFFKTPYYKRTIVSQVQGANINNLKTRDIDDLLIPIPKSFDTQKRIAKVLSDCEGLIAKRKESIALLDELLKSTFLEMFGDPVKNEKGWSWDNLENITHEDCPLSYGIVQPGEDFINGVPVVRPVDLNGDFVDREGLKLIDPEISKKYKRTILNGGEILFVVRGTTGVVSIAKSELKGANVTRGISPIWLKEGVNNRFVLHLIKSQPFQNLVSKKTYGIALKQINIRDLRVLPIIQPNEELQNEFTSIVEKVEGIKQLYKIHLQELENLYGSLSQKAFKGELDVSKVVLPEDKTSPPRAIEKKEGKEAQSDDDYLNFDGDSELDYLPATDEKTNDSNKFSEQVSYEIAKSDVIDAPKIEDIELRKIYRKKLVEFVKNQNGNFSKFLDDFHYRFENRNIEIDYELLKQELFEILGDKHSAIKQWFNQESEQLEFKFNETKES